MILRYFVWHIRNAKNTRLNLNKFIALCIAVSTSYKYDKCYVFSPGTDIKSALLNGLSFLNAGMNRDRGTKMIFFLTDGALFGVKKTALMEIKYANIYDIPIYSIAFGEDADSEFLQHLSRQNHGESRRVNDSNEAVNDITDLFQDIPETMLRNLTFWYPFYKQAVTSQTSFKTYLNGTEISVAGYIEKHSKNNSVDVDVDFEADQNENITNIKKYMVLKPDDKFCPDDYICLPAYMQEFVENTMVHKKILEMIAEINNKKQNSHAAKLLMKKIIFMSMKVGPSIRECYVSCCLPLTNNDKV